MKKFYLIFLFLVIGLVSTVTIIGLRAWTDTIRIHITINERFYDKFDNKAFTMNDFQANEIKDFFYYVYYDDNDIIRTRQISIRLKRPGEKYAQKVVEHLSKLDFAKQVGYSYTNSGTYQGELI